MLIRFNISNFLSFNKETEFNMLAANVRRHPEHITKFKGIKLLKSSVIYGANGSGKTNFIYGLNVLQEIVMNGELMGFSNSNKFKLDPKNKDLPISFEVEFIWNKKAYAYGIVFHEGLIEEEWLFQLNLSQKSEDLVFERKTNAKGKAKLKFHPKYLKTEKNRLLKEVYEEDLLKKNVPFLHLAKNRKFKEIKDAFEWFQDGILLISPGSKFTALPTFIDNHSDFQEFANKLIRELDTGIKELVIKDIEFDSFFGEDNLAERDRVLRLVNEGEDVPLVESNAVAYLEDGVPIVKKLYCIHESSLAGEVEFELYEESQGSLRLFDFLPVIYLALNQSVSIIIDEIDQSLHINLLRELIQKIQSESELVGQLIFTTHEANLLDLDLFRQDEIWFTEKDKTGASNLYPLSDYNIRTEMDISKGYLTGRFGAVPFLGNLKNLDWKITNGEKKE